MTINEFIETNFVELRSICRAVIRNRSKADDLFQESAVRLLVMKSKSLQKAIDAGDGVFFYRAMVRRMVLPQDKFIRTYEIPRERFEKAELKREKGLGLKRLQKMEIIDELIRGRRYYDREIFRLYFFERYSFTKLARETGISRSALYWKIDQIKNEIKEILDGFDQFDIS